MAHSNNSTGGEVVSEVNKALSTTTMRPTRDAPMQQQKKAVDMLGEVARGALLA